MARHYFQVPCRLEVPWEIQNNQPPGPTFRVLRNSRISPITEKIKIQPVPLRPQFVVKNRKKAILC